LRTQSAQTHKKQIVFMENILLSLLCLPVLGAILIALFPSSATRQMKVVALTVSLINFLLSLNLWIFF